MEQYPQWSYMKCIVAASGVRFGLYDPIKPHPL